MRYEILHLKDTFPFLGEGGCDPTLEVYLQENLAQLDRQDQKRPCILLCPGGGYRFVSRREAEPVALHFLPEGFNVFVLTYSTAPNRFPIQLRQVAAAMELIHENAAAWSCDVTKIALMGFSAGGHLAAHYTNRYYCPQVREVFPDSKPVAASILCYSVITADPAYSHRGSFEKLAGGYPQTQEQIDFYSCEKMVSEKTPPTFLWHCTGDKTVPVQNSLLYAQALAEYKVPFQMHIYPLGKHGMSTCDLQTSNEVRPDVGIVKDWLPALKKWLIQVFEIPQQQYIANETGM